MTVFENMLKLLHIWGDEHFKFDNSISDYIKHYRYGRLDLKNADLRGVDLSGGDLEDADLVGADLSGANLSGANLRKADLHEAVLIGADIKGIDLDIAYLGTAVFDVEQIEYLKSRYPLAEVKVYINETNSVISYQEYKKKYKEILKRRIKTDKVKVC